MNRDPDGPRDALVILGHGSRRPEGLEVVVRTVARMRQRLGANWVIAEAYMELAQPDLDTTISGLLQRHPIDRLVIMPLFLSLGTHVASQLPEAAGRLCARYPDVQIQVTRHIGADPLLSDIVLQRVEEVVDGELD